MSMAKSKAAQSDEIKSQVQAVLVKYHQVAIRIRLPKLTRQTNV